MKSPIQLPSGLKRYPIRKTESLQAWDSADELLIQHLAENFFQGTAQQKLLIIGDQFGALSAALASLPQVTTYTDSFVSDQAIRLNTQNKISPIHELKDLSGTYDWVLIRIPKNMSFFEDILCHVSQHITSTSKLVCGYMMKHYSKSSFDLLNQVIGPTQTSLAQRKARLIFAESQKKPTPSPYPIHVPIEGFEKPFVNHSNLFSREKLDIGTRFFLAHIPQGMDEPILDLGCANGIIGIAAQLRNPKAEIIFSDDSWMALLSAKANYRNFFPDHSTEHAKFRRTNCFENQPQESVGWVLCNPPFHQGNTVGDFIAQQMFRDSHRALKRGGTLRVIGNAHLEYPMKLKRVFGNSKMIASNSKFVVIDAIKT